MNQPITDYGAFLREAKQAVADLNEMQQREAALTQQLAQSRRQLEMEEKAVADHISQTIKRRAADLASGYDKELSRGQERLKKARSRREKAKSQGVKERISEETKPPVRIADEDHISAESCAGILQKQLVLPAVCSKKAGRICRLFGGAASVFPGDSLWKLSFDPGEEAAVSGTDLFCVYPCV